MQEAERRLKVYIDKAWLQTGERLLPLARYLFGQKEHALPTFRDEFAHNMPFETVELAPNANDSDFLYVPVPYRPDLVEEYPQLIKGIEHASSHFDKVVLAQGVTADIVKPEELMLPFANCIYLNPALLRSKTQKNFFPLPYFIPDCLEKYYGGELQLLEKENLPSLGFCGVAAPLKTPLSKTKVFDIARLALSLIDDIGLDSEKFAQMLGTNMKHAHRTKAILRLRSSKKVKFEAIVRSQGGLVNKNYTNIDDYDAYNTEFYDNLRRNLYSLCSRGTENYSVRFYETFCMGRIPVLIDTDVVLPFESEIDYEKHCVWIPKPNVRKIENCILSYHERRSNSELCAIQRQNREIWERFYSNCNFWYELQKHGLSGRANYQS